MAKNVHSIIDELKAGLSELQSHFENLGSIFGGSEKTTPGGRKSAARARRRAPRRAAGRPAAPAAPAKKARKKPTLSPAVRAQRRLQGRYMAKFKGLSKTRQAQVRKVREEKGYEAALKMMG
ncbi:MAG TPA: hypothetical protein VFS34_05630 [Thermoanaerobaculia bacterium]|nr:hypothetical protein [Thermoanaerobaculia bacterium]